MFSIVCQSQSSSTKNKKANPSQLGYFRFFSRSLLVWVAVLLFSCQVVSNSFVTPQTVAHQAPLSMDIPQQEYGSVLSFPPPGALPNPGDQICISCIGRWILYHRATGEACTSLRESSNWKTHGKVCKTVILEGQSSKETVLSSVWGWIFFKF